MTSIQQIGLNAPGVAAGMDRDGRVAEPFASNNGSDLFDRVMFTVVNIP